MRTAVPNADASQGQPHGLNARAQTSYSHL